jgi:ankyrin repeat protein
LQENAGIAKMDKNDRDYLAAAFRDLWNYGAEDISQPVDPFTYKTPEGDSCLHYAAGRGDVRSIQLLVDAGLDVNFQGDMGYTPLHWAAMSGKTDAVKKLLESGADINRFLSRPFS